MVPPAPVTSITWRRSLLANRAVSGATASRPSKSSTSSSRRSCTLSRPLVRSFKLGKVRVCTCKAPRRAMIWLRRSRVALGRASTMSVASNLRTTSGAADAANTGTPLMVCPIFVLSSSRKPSSLNCPVTASAVAICAPASPAP